MGSDDSPLFLGLKQRMAWLSRRQQVLAQNIANADTPNYRPRDLKAQSFQALVRSAATDVAPRATHSRHLTGTPAAAGEPRAEGQRHTFETAPAGNAVVIEEQMAKVNESALSHRLTTELYKKHLSMLKIAIGRRN